MGARVEIPLDRLFHMHSCSAGDGPDRRLVGQVLGHLRPLGALAQRVLRDLRLQDGPQQDLHRPVPRHPGGRAHSPANTDNYKRKKHLTTTRPARASFLLLKGASAACLPACPSARPPAALLPAALLPVCCYARPKRPHDGPRWSKDGPTLAPIWPQDSPRWLQDGP